MTIKLEDAISIALIAIDNQRSSQYYVVYEFGIPNHEPDLKMILATHSKHWNNNDNMDVSAKGRYNFNIV